ncbi:hypothetical protein LY76DRAFT_163230 [Colletotrichum caudatum]|nr:hypothetical protein LY76DRAFT_163230 [Colletotrichum caudatum]
MEQSHLPVFGLIFYLFSVSYSTCFRSHILPPLLLSKSHRSKGGEHVRPGQRHPSHPLPSRTTRPTSQPGPCGRQMSHDGKNLSLPASHMFSPRVCHIHNLFSPHVLELCSERERERKSRRLGVYFDVPCSAIPQSKLYNHPFWIFLPSTPPPPPTINLRRRTLSNQPAEQGRVAVQ